MDAAHAVTDATEMYRLATHKFDEGITKTGFQKEFSLDIAMSSNNNLLHDFWRQETKRKLDLVIVDVPPCRVLVFPWFIRITVRFRTGEAGRN